MDQPPKPPSDLEREDANPGFFREYLRFLKESRKLWLIPLLVILVLFSALLILGATSAAPWIYTLF
jgi:hypothetical protein